MDESVPSERRRERTGICEELQRFVYVNRDSIVIKDQGGVGAFQGRQPAARVWLLQYLPPCPSRGTLSLHLQFPAAGNPREKNSKPITLRQSLRIG